MPTLGAPELIIILVIIILIFGVGKLPEVGQALGKGIREFRGAADGAEDEEPPAAPARPAAPAPAAVDAPRPAPAVEAPRQPVATAPAPAAAPASAPAPVTAPSAAPAATTSSSYTVVAGDTPETVAKSHGVSVEELLAANGWSQKDRVLYEGDKIQVPAKNTTL
ncbi:MAG TPA: twin-arginine translocase TatA/TatE family subunit [Chloroflexota bacterium]|nr:twin-arginine translocase TatA/TatE family subunit [Chloroflexota bacterium]